MAAAESQENYGPDDEDRGRGLGDSAGGEIVTHHRGQLGAGSRIEAAAESQKVVDVGLAIVGNVAVLPGGERARAGAVVESPTGNECREVGGGAGGAIQVNIAHRRVVLMSRDGRGDLRVVARKVDE